LTLGHQWKAGITKIGLDGKFAGRGKGVHNVTDLEGRTIIGVFPMKGQKAFKGELFKIPLQWRLQVKEVCTDLDAYYISLVKECFPNARVVADHYHVVAWAVKKMEDFRRLLQQMEGKKADIGIRKLLTKASHTLTESEFQKLKHFFLIFPEVKLAWKCVHQVRRIYWQKNWKKGESQLRKALWLCEKSCIPEMKELAKTLRRHKPNILNYYLSKTTNAFTEGVHTRFELLERGHCGVKNMDRFAKRLLFSFLPFSLIAQSLL